MPIKNTLKAEKIICIVVDGRHDEDTLLYKEIEEADGKKKLQKTKETEHHLTFTKEMGCGENGKYLTHRVIITVGATSAVLAKEVASVWEEYNSVDTPKAVLLDNTHTNTGCKAGLVTVLEKQIKRKLHTLVVLYIKMSFCSELFLSTLRAT